MNWRGVPQELKDAPCRAKGDTFVMHNKDLLLVKLRDRKMVHFLSTISSAAPTDTGKVNRETGQPIMKPALNIEYDQYKGGGWITPTKWSATPHSTRVL